MSESESRSTPPRAISRVLLGAGGVTLVAAFAADALGFGGAPGIGPKQIALAVFGAVLLAAGAALATGNREQAFRAWLVRTLDAAPALTPGSCLALAACIGLFTGFFEVLHQGSRKYFADLILKQPIDLIWMAPTAYLLLFTVVGALLVIGILAAPRWFRLPTAVFALVLLATWSQIRLHPLAEWARVLLCAGAAAQIAKMAASNAQATLRRARRALVGLSALLVLAIVGVPAGRALLEARAHGSHPPPGPDAPNVLLIVLDTVRADHLGLYGYERDTSPTIDALGERGIVFDKLISTSPWTLPSHATLFTARYGKDISVEWLRALDDEHDTLAEKLTENGYATAGFVGNLVYCLREQGVGRGFTHYEDFQVEPGVFAMSTSIGRFLTLMISPKIVGSLARNNAPTVTEGFKSWLDGVEDRPFFAFLNYFDAHAPYEPPPPFDTEFGPKTNVVLERFKRQLYPPHEIQGFIDAYDGAIKYVDTHVADILAHLEAKGLLDNTLVVITADHGEQFGEHGLMDHGNSLYLPLLHVPLLISFPGKLSPARVTDYVSLADLPATILELIGMDPALLPGTSLSRTWTGGGPSDSPLLSEVKAGLNTPRWEPIAKGYMASLVKPPYHYILNGDGAGELYDLSTDWAEENNLIDARPDDARRMHEALEKALGRE